MFRFILSVLVCFCCIGRREARIWSCCPIIHVLVRVLLGRCAEFGIDGHSPVLVLQPVEFLGVYVKCVGGYRVSVAIVSDDDSGGVSCGISHGLEAISPEMVHELQEVIPVVDGEGKVGDFHAAGGVWPVLVVFCGKAALAHASPERKIFRGIQPLLLDE